jgi:hypothetical protein
MPELPRIRLTVRAIDAFNKKIASAIEATNRLILLTYQKPGGTFIYCTWSKRTGPHTLVKCTYKTRIVRGGAKKMRRHFAKEHLHEL